MNFVSKCTLKKSALCSLYFYASSYHAYISVHFPFISHFNPEDGSSSILRNFGVQPSHYTVQ